jgi:hypothetical protein
MSQSDQEINRGVRSVLSRNWLDLSKTNFASRRGIVRLMGELRRLGAESSKPLEPHNLDALDSEIKRLRGVDRVHFDLRNWRRNSEGEWVQIVDEDTQAHEHGDDPPPALPRR